MLQCFNQKSSERIFWENNRPSSTEDELKSLNSETTFSPPESEASSRIQSLSPATLIETYEDEMQSLQKSNVEWKAKYRAVKDELLVKKRGSRKLESENQLLKKTLEKCQTDLRQANIKVVDLNKKLILAIRGTPSKTARKQTSQEQKTPHTNSGALLSLIHESPTRPETENSSITEKVLFLLLMIFGIYIVVTIIHAVLYYTKTIICYII